MKCMMWSVAAVVALACGQQADAGILLYLKVTGVDGPVTTKGFEKSIAVDEFGIAVTVPTSTGKTGGAGTAKPVFSAFQVEGATSKASPLLFGAAVTGKILEEVKLSVVDTGAKGELRTVATWTLSEAVVSAYKSGGSAGDASPHEMLDFAFAGIEYAYFGVDNNGKPTGEVKASWDLKTGTASGLTTTGTVDDFQFITGTLPEPTSLFWLAAGPVLAWRRSRRAG